ncbi:MAG: penicillin-binding transpeptidase domain-containing protein [Chloroflexi bacterium]|nr:penicillin-binding transpeptidase domain-containing protein [Chloroflexota bacterium]
MSRRKFTFRRRLIALLAFFLLYGVVLSGRLAYFQIGQHTVLASKADAEHWSEEQIIPRRGTISDRNGHVLASNISADNVYAVPQLITDPASVAGVLSGVIGEPTEKLIPLLSEQNSGWVLLKQRLDVELSTKLEEMNIPGIYIEHGVKRTYPDGEFAAQVLGFANYENKGAYGVEGAYDSIVGGVPGVMLAERDSNGNRIGVGTWEWKPPTEGSDLVLTIDSAVQHIVETRLDEAITDNKALSGTIIVMDPKTGAILGMASRPTFDPNRFATTDEELFKNPAISDLYEPGSTFKVVTMAAGLDTGVVQPTTTFDCKGQVTVYGYTIYNWDHTAHGQESMTDVLVRSCNIGSSFVSTQLGSDAFYRYVQAFGFGQPTGIDLQGEEAGIVKQPGDDTSGWTPIDLYTNSFGQGISATPLQVVSAVAAVANGGKLMRPYIVQKVIQDGKVVTDTQPTVVRQVVKPEVAHELTNMLVESVNRGEAKEAGVPGYLIAGKTGTAQVPQDGGYDSTATIGSTIAYAPANDPKFVVFVKLDKPADNPWGSRTAGPVVGEITRDLLMYYRIPPTEKTDASGQ